MIIRKRRSFTQLMEERSLRLIYDEVPAGWVMHDYAPDYGIDVVIEIFEEVKDVAPQVFETLGELIFVQAKSQERLEYSDLEVRSRSNVEKSAAEDRPDPDFDTIIPVISFSCDVPLLNTVSSMGAAAPVILTVADLATSKTYFVCLNDYIDKILRPRQPSFSSQGTVTIKIPTRNLLSKDNRYGIDALRLYGKRSKYYAAFNLFAYQFSELRVELSVDMARHFIRRIEDYDFWIKASGWREPLLMGPIILSLRKRLDGESPTDDPMWCVPIEEHILFVWEKLANLGAIFEEVVREAFLPTVLGDLL